MYEYTTIINTMTKHVTLKLSPSNSVRVSIGTFLALLWCQFDHVINAQDSDGSLSGKLETLNLAHSWLQHSRLLVVTDSTIDQVQTHPTGEGQSCDQSCTFLDTIYITLVAQFLVLIAQFTMFAHGHM